MPEVDGKEVGPLCVCEEVTVVEKGIMLKRMSMIDGAGDHER